MTQAPLVIITVWHSMSSKRIIKSLSGASVANKRIPILSGFLLLALCLWMQITPFVPVRHFITSLTNLAYDMQLRTHLFTHPLPSNSPIAIVDIDDKSLAKIGRWPWSRDKLAELIDKLQQDGVVVAAFDVIFSEPENNIATLVATKLNKEKLATPAINALLQKITADFDADAKFAVSLKKLDVILGVSFSPTSSAVGTLSAPLLTLPANSKLHYLITLPGFLANIAPLQQTAKNNGFINVYPDEDGIIRRVPLLIRYQNGLYPSLALAAVSTYLLSAIQLHTGQYLNETRLESIQLGQHIIPTDREGQALVPFRGGSFTFPTYSVIDILEGRLAPDALQGKIVFIGTSATGLGDLKPTAIQNVFPGIEIQATMAAGILDDVFSIQPDWAQGFEILLTIFPGLLFIFLFPRFGPRALSLFVIGIPACFMFASYLLWTKTSFLLTVLIPIVFNVLLAFINMIYGYLFESRRRERLHEMFGQYVPAKHIDEMLSANDQVSLLGESREMTVLFADIRSFTTISEGLTAAALKELLNHFFTPMTEIIFNHNGTIDKYVGDMIMAFWGAPMTDPAHARHAISAALAMQQKVKELHVEFHAKGWPEVNIGIGLNTGTMSVGDMGSKFRRSYTVLGDAVNLASRVESLTKYYGVGLMVTEFTLAGIDDFVVKKLDRVRVKGKNAGVDIFAPLCRREQASAELLAEIDSWHKAFSLYLQQQWPAAHAIIQTLATAHPHTKVYSLYLQRIAEYQQTPPPADWDGIYTHTTK